MCEAAVPISVACEDSAEQLVCCSIFVQIHGGGRGVTNSAVPLECKSSLVIFIYESFQPFIFQGFLFLLSE